MEKLKVELGVRVFQIPGGGTLRFNPADPNVYSRFYEAEEKLSALEGALSQGGDGIQAMAMADRELKSVFNWLLGGDNDVDKALGGVSLLAVCGNGHTVAANLVSALKEILEAGAKQLVNSKAASL